MGYLDFGKNERINRILRKAREEGWSEEKLIQEVKNELQKTGELAPSGELSQGERDRLIRLLKKK